MISINEMRSLLFDEYSIDRDIEYESVTEANNTSLGAHSTPKDGEVWMVQMPYFNFENPKNENIGCKTRRCVILNDSDYGLVAIRLSSYDDSDPDQSKSKETRHNYPYNYDLTDLSSAGCSKGCYLVGNDFVVLHACRVFRQKGKLCQTDYDECVKKFKRFKKDRFKAIQYLMDWLTGLQIKPLTINNTTKMQTVSEIEKSREASRLDICNLFLFVTNKFKIYHRINHIKYSNGLQLFFPMYKSNGKIRTMRFDLGRTTHCILTTHKNKDAAINDTAKFFSKLYGITCKFTGNELSIDANKYITQSSKNGYLQMDVINTINQDYLPLYFYHLAPEDADISKGLLSPYAAYKVGNKELVTSMLNKYRMRAVNQWKYYPNRDPESLTVEELLDSLNRVRGKDGDKCIYFFKYPPYAGLGKNMKKSLEKYHVPYRININDPELKKHIIRIDWGWPQSDFTKPALTKDYYVNVSKKEYFSKYTDNPKPGQPIFAPMSHISIAFKDGICPAKFLEKVNPKKKNLNESFIEMIKPKTDDEVYYQSLLEYAIESITGFSKDSNIILSEDDIYCNFWDFKNNRIHYCFVTGFSGSGKTNLARNLAKKYNAEWVSLDVLLYDSRVHKMTERFTHGTQKQRLLAKYIKENDIDLSYMKDVNFKETVEARAIMVETGKKFIDWLINKNTDRVIIEGLDLIDIIPTDPRLYSAPIVFKGTSRAMSMFRRLQRNKFKAPLSMIINMFKWYKTDAHGIDYMRNIIINDYNAQYRKEPGEYNKRYSRYGGDYRQE